ncbi:MAG: hypothetical protein DRI44_06960 [Chlamydiae bacterium]|nr:MAG: hypothetical protein DRI44_06960 [Chlamydiota bacterium]
MRLLSLIFIAFLLSGCIRYSETWRFNENGSGTVRIICEPSPEWLKHSGATNWFQSVLLFIPPYKSLSQEFARVGVKFKHCKFATKKGKPYVDMLIAFNSLTSISRTSLFSDRLLQWRKKPFKVTLLHQLSTKRPLGKAEMASLGDNLLADAAFDVKMYFPGRVISVEGAKKKGNCAFINANLAKLAMGKAITISATARTGYSLWFKIMLATMILIVAGLIILILRKLIIKHFENNNANPPIHTQPL